MNKPFPLPSVLVALRDVLRWLIEYEPPPGPATGGRVDISVNHQEEEQDG